jgi:N-acetylglucosaminyldiphosphoundecaprenol N-acetyl-beta-D-mannosaminyltransferase
MGQVNEAIRRVELLGAAVDIVDAEGVLGAIAEAAGSGRKLVVANHNLHSLYLRQKDREMAAFYERADLIEIDSMPLVLWGQLMGLQTHAENRCTYLDWRDAFWTKASSEGWRVFCLGGAPGVAEEAVRRLSAAWPGAVVEGHHGYFDHASGSAENAAVIDQINAFRPDVVLVGMGMPLQELWISRNYGALARGALLPVGAAIDYEAGVQAAAPRILGQLCLEWLFRLAADPQRLGRRYLVEPWSLIPAALRDMLRYGLGVRPAARMGVFARPAAVVAETSLAAAI